MAMNGAPRVCGDDPYGDLQKVTKTQVLPAYAGMIPTRPPSLVPSLQCSPRMRG